MPKPFAWRQPRPVPLDLNGPVDRPYHALPSDFAERTPFDLLRGVAARDPDALAIAGSAERITYRDLLCRIGQVARCVAAMEPGAVAAVVPETPAGIAAILGCLIARRMVLLLDPSQPAHRIATILSEARPAIVITADDGGGSIGPPRRIALPRLFDGPDEPAWEPPDAFGPDEPAVVFYTSGSTGQPKGIVVSMWRCLQRARQSIDAWHIGPDDRVLSIAQQGTQPSVAGYMAALLAGACAVQYAAITEGLGALRDRLEQEAVTILIGGPALLRTVLALPAFGQPLATLRVLRAGGAALLRSDVAAARAVLPAGCLIAHAYSSTEASVMAYWVVPADHPGNEPHLPSGYLGADLEFALHDSDGPDGVGELVVRGRTVTLGEWQDGRCVPGRVLPDPDRPGWRIFRTGDLVRFGPDGLLRVVGRADQQVKVNGVRVEPAEVEAVLRGVAGVTDAVVVARMRHDQPMLQAYVASSAEPTALRRTLHARLRTELPSAMRPASIVLLERLPRLPSGKLDFQALPAPAPRGLVRRAMAAMRPGKTP